MTIGIAAFGPDAGAAILAAWAQAEALGAGEIGGFAVFTALPQDADPISVECQRGGLQTIRAEWTDNGVLARMALAPVAAVITSGPDRPLPLAQFLAVGHAGLVTGHRLPNLPGADRVPMNIAALRKVASGVEPQDAVTQVCEENPGLDAGLIAVTTHAIGMAETAFVQRRGDRGQILLQDKGRALALLHNSITPVRGLADVVARAGMAGFSQNPLG